MIRVLPGRVDRSGGGGSVVVGAASAILVAVGALHVAGSLLSVTCSIFASW